MLSLTGPFMGWGMIVFTLLVSVSAVVLWPRLASGGPVQILGRASLLVVINLLVLLTAAVQLNDAFLFFADWADLHGALAGTTSTTALHRGGIAGQATRQAVTGPAATAAAALLPLPAGSAVEPGVTSYRVTGPISGLTSDIVVALPNGYRADTGTRYPVLETFSGYPGVPAQWVKAFHLPQVMAAQVAAGRLRPAVVVSPQVEIPAGVDTECVDGLTGEPQVETWLTRDVPDWIAAHFRVRTDRSSWATLGMSTGGWCAAMAAMLHPAQYGGAIVMAGYFHPIFGPQYEPFPARSPQEDRYDLVALVRRGPPPTALWLGTSHADALSYSTSATILAKARSPLAISAVVLRNAGHRTSVWLDLLPQALAWLGSSLAGFSAHGAS